MHDINKSTSIIISMNLLMSVKIVILVKVKKSLYTRVMILGQYHFGPS